MASIQSEIEIIIEKESLNHPLSPGILDTNFASLRLLKFTRTPLI